MIGKTIGKYRVIGQLGRGGMGTVYKAVDDTLEREVAIKVLNPELADSEVIKRFRQEAITLAKLSHPEIATIYELLRSDADLLMVMELVRGETLDSICRRLSAIPPERAVYLADKILSALGHAHNAGIVHCDMKPANVMVTGQGSVKLMDFGIARVRGADQSTPVGRMIGTPAYMPPEQALGKEVDARSDLYSVGIILYRLLTGAVPFSADTAMSLVQQQISDAPTPLHVHRQGLPDWCESILSRALAKSPDDRFQTAEEFRSTLQKAAGNPDAETARMYFSTICEPETIEIRTGVLERLGLTRRFGATPPIDLSATRPAMSTVVVLPQSRRKLTAILVGAPVCILLATGFVLRLGKRDEMALAAPPPIGLDAVVENLPAPSIPQPPPGFRMRRAEGASLAASLPASQPVTSATPKSASSPTPASRTSAPAAVPYVFDARLLMTEGDRGKERECQVFLINGMINVKAKDDDSLLYALPLEAIQSITYSEGRDPMWKGPDGPTRVARGPASLGIFTGPRHWVSLYTESPSARFVVLRIGNDDRTRSAIAAFEQRTGQSTVMLTEDLK